MRPLWEDQDWNEEPEGEEQGEIQQMSCLREEVEGDGGMRTLEQEVSEEEAAKMNYKGKWIRVEAEMDTGGVRPHDAKECGKASAHQRVGGI